MSENEQPELEQLDQELVAYLDGEADSVTARRLEELLARDPQMQERARSLERAWDTLDLLPRSRASDSFTTSTVEMIAIQESQLAETKGASAKAKRVAQAFVGGLALLAIATTGYAVGSGLAARHNAQLLQHLPLIEHLDQFQQLEDVQFLRRLHDSGVFAGVKGSSQRND
jgi:anti-sigma factor RsiW